MNDWGNSYKSLALVGGALIVAASFYYQQTTTGFFGIRKNVDMLVLIGTVLLAAFFIACGYAHFKWADFVKELMPAFIPFRLFWAYFCGVCLVAGGIGILIPKTKKLAALLSGIMILIFFLLVHIPRTIANSEDKSDRMGLFESLAIAGIFFVLAAVTEKRKS
jgi:uncharacterized membrane protein YphA (DoxX/SURF4 family)